MAEKKAQKLKTVNSKQARYLRGLGHALTPSVMMGKDGITKTLIITTLESFNTKELIKVKLLNTCPLDRHEASKILAKESGSAIAQILGNTILLYKENKKLPEDQRIYFPS